MVHWAQKAHAEWQGKWGWKALRSRKGNHFDTNNTLPPISLINAFLQLKVYYSGKSAAVVFLLEGSAAMLGRVAACA